MRTTVRPLLMLLEKLYQKTAFLIFPTGFFQAPVLIFTAYQNKKGNKKVVFTGRLQGGVCSLYSIGESVQCIHSLLYVLDNLTNNTSPRTADIGPLPTLCTYLQPWRSTAHGLRSFRTRTTTQQMHLEGRNVPCKQYCASGL